jgi:predicted ATPase
MFKTIKIRNFKSLGDVTVNLDPVTVLIGPTGTGKSNFVEALRFLREYLLLRNEAAIIQRSYGGWQQLVCATADRPITLDFSLQFDAPGLGVTFHYDLGFREQQFAANAQLQRPPSLAFYEEKLCPSGKAA